MELINLFYHYLFGVSRKFTKDKGERNMNSKSKYEEIPVYNVRMMSDDEWNRLAYKNYLQRKQQENKNEKQTYQNT